MVAAVQIVSTLASHAITLGPLTISNRAFLAPLSGVTDIGMRRVAQCFGAGLVVSEMVAADAYLVADEEARLRAQGEGVFPHVVQIVGRSPRSLAEAARLAEANGADVIDINMGCPAKRVVGGYAGSALMREPALAVDLVHAVVAAVRVPVTVKMRLGWDDASRNASDLARRCVSEGARMISVHGRTRQQFYNGRADWSAIRAVRDVVSVPLVANGDCTSADDAHAMISACGADAVMIGRAAIGRPWLPGAIAASLRGEAASMPDADARRDCAVAHYRSLLSTMGLTTGLRHARKHLVAYARGAAEDGFSVSHATARRLATSECFKEVESLLTHLWERAVVEQMAA